MSECDPIPDSSMRVILKSIMKSIAEECDAEILEAKTLFGNKINQHLVSPVLQKIYKDLFPYVCAVAIVLLIILIFVLLLMFVVVTQGLHR
jgi:hypothetical protein